MTGRQRDLRAELERRGSFTRQPGGERRQRYDEVIADEQRTDLVVNAGGGLHSVDLPVAQFSHVLARDDGADSQGFAVVGENRLATLNDESAGGEVGGAGGTGRESVSSHPFVPAFDSLGLAKGSRHAGNGRRFRRFREQGFRAAVRKQRGEQSGMLNEGSQ